MLFRSLANLPHGLFLICGPTGSGKTTTLHSVLGYINTPKKKIWTAEDPIEITQSGLRQVQVNPKIGLTFAVAMRSFLRLDPDVIMVGEMRDAETAKTGIEASLTGHLVFSTLHTNSAVESVIRLLDLGMDPFNFADALLGVVSQRLVRSLCPDCRRPNKASAEEIDDLLKEYCDGTTLEPAAVRARWQSSYADKQGASHAIQRGGLRQVRKARVPGPVGYSRTAGEHARDQAADPGPRQRRKNPEYRHRRRHAHAQAGCDRESPAGANRHGTDSIGGDLEPRLPGLSPDVRRRPQTHRRTLDRYAAYPAPKMPARAFSSGRI